MFDKNYYCLVAGLREYSLDADTKGFNARAIIEEILEGVSARDARCVRLLYGYYDCENLVNFRKGRPAGCDRGADQEPRPASGAYGDRGPFLFGHRR